jgi:GDP-4-dehydro-6-deoxy-D-mannose reductase
MSELVAERFSRHFKVPTVIVRPFNHIGAGQRQDFAVSNFANQLAQISKKSRAPVLHVGNLEAQRDFTDVRDIVRGYRLAAQSGKGTYNLCSGTPIAMSEILDRLIKISGSQVTLEQDPSRMRRSDTPLLYGSAAKAKADFGWAPEHSLDASLKHVYDFWLKS